MSTSDDDLFEFDADNPPELSDYGKRFVERVPEEERQYAEKYVREWDAGVSKLKSKYEDELNTYKSYGAREDIEAGVQLYKMLTGGESEQQKIADYLAENGITPSQFKKMQEDAADGKQVTLPGTGGKVKTPEIDYEERFKKLEAGLGMTAQQLQQWNAVQQQERAKAEFLELCKEAEKKHGKFDLEYAAFLLANGKASTMDEAASIAANFVPSEQRRAATPNLLGASGNAPLNGGKKIDYGKLSDNDVSKLIQHRLEQARLANG